MMKFSEKLDLISVFIDPSKGIPGGPQSQFIHFNNEINTIMTEYILIKIKIINEYQINRIYKNQQMLSINCDSFVSYLRIIISYELIERIVNDILRKLNKKRLTFNEYNVCEIST